MNTTNMFAKGMFVLCLLTTALQVHGEETAVESKVDFARQILPILSNKCFVCHGPDTHDEEMLRLDTFAGATSDRGGYRALDPGSPNDSEIINRIHSEDDPMPPEEAEKKLTDQERNVLTEWVRQGGTYAKHWAFEKPIKQNLHNRNEIKNTEAIDAFVGLQLQQNKVDFAPEAERTVLARRVALTLTGLPPEPEQLAEFLNDKSPQAYSRLVEKLLSSPRFGEHQARYWLDVIRYGDTHGLHLDNRRGIFPFRDWVVYAMNKNLPWDQFITWQLAGDLLPNPTLEQLVATGFVRMNPTTSEGGAIPAEFQAKNNFDRTETLGTVFLGMSLTCARCHTHKYDPIPQTEYYRLLAFFNSTAESSMDGNKYEYGPTAKAPHNQAGWIEWTALQSNKKKLVQEAQDSLAGQASDSEFDSKWSRSDNLGKWKLIADEKGKFAGSPLQKQAQAIAVRIAELEKSFTTTLVAKELEKPRDTHVLKRGEYNLPVGDPVEPGILSVMGAFPSEAPRNRLGLARWLTSREHPLVSRVLVNQIWLRTFGEALVRSPEDFGLQGQQPTHPMLLDWLAVEFQDSGWDLKHMLRLMVNSRTFRQSSVFRSDWDDPENRFYGRGPSYRLDAEVLRDLALWSSGLLVSDMGGEGVKPYQPDGMWLALAHPASNTKKYVRDKGQKLYRRSLYVYWKRTSPHPMMTLFDAPSRESSCVMRSRTNTSLQSLGLFNETQRMEMSRMLAERLLSEAKDDNSRLNLLFGWLTCRLPTESERAVCDRLLQQQRARYAKSEQDAIALLSIGEAQRNASLPAVAVAAWTQVAVTVLASDLSILMY